MYGPKPPAARRLAHPLADGGLVARMKSADAGPAAFGSRGLSQLRDMIPKMQAMGYQQAPATPAADPRAAKLQAMIPQMEAMGFKQNPQYLAGGGMIRGPGTGTSDSIPDEMEPGTYIMPADSTRQLGLDDKKVPVRVSNGEYELPPEQVQAVGAAVLDAIKGVTHTPKSRSARGLQSPQGEQFFATGGSVRDPEELRKMIPQVEAMGYQLGQPVQNGAPHVDAVGGMWRCRGRGRYFQSSDSGACFYVRGAYDRPYDVFAASVTDFGGDGGNRFLYRDGHGSHV